MPPVVLLSSVIHCWDDLTKQDWARIVALSWLGSCRWTCLYSDWGLHITLPFDVSSTVQLTVHVFGKKLRATRCFHVLFSSVFFMSIL
jgi:hypothetical protein